MKKILLLLIFAVIFAWTVISCKKIIPPAPPNEEVLAGTIEGLNKQQEKEHLTGDAAFAKIFTSQEGLGPIFVQSSCSNCHSGNGKGHPSNILTRFASVTGTLVNYLPEKGGPQLQHRSISGYVAESLPGEANVFTKRMAPVVMGLGFIGALNDQSILANADPNDANADGISGRVNYVSPAPFFIPQNIHIPNNGFYIGRFGKKAEKVSLNEQVVFALKQDIGITSPFDVQDLYNIQIGNNTGDDVPDPEVSSSFVNSLVFYLRTLKAPERRNADNTDVIEGQKLFFQVGCADCHKPDFTTDISDITALSNKVFHPYSDFLLHDMGAALDDGYPESAANSFEWRTPPLWGLGLAKDSQGGNLFLLHDGRASSIENAISFHGGEAATRVSNFNALNQEQKNQLIKFLESL